MSTAIKTVGGIFLRVRVISPLVILEWIRAPLTMANRESPSEAESFRESKPPTRLVSKLHPPIVKKRSSKRISLQGLELADFTLFVNGR